jgi:hypothetical protein
MIDLGIRSGGGIADNLPVVAFKSNPVYFMKRFFYDVTFQIVIVMILGKLL